MSNRSTYEASVKAAGPTKLDSVQNVAQVTMQTTIDAVNSVIGYRSETGNNANLVSTTRAAAAARLEAYANAEKAKQASIALARDTLRTAGGDNAPF